MECYAAFTGVEDEHGELLGVYTSFARAKDAIVADITLRFENPYNANTTTARNYNLDTIIESVQRDLVKDVTQIWRIMAYKDMYVEIIQCELNQTIN